jgi:hypothetical protein
LKLSLMFGGLIMSYDLYPRNKELNSISIPWVHLLKHAGNLYQVTHKGAQWYRFFFEDDELNDKRFMRSPDYPSIISNDGFYVTADEARILARIARNYVGEQKSIDREEYEKEVDRLKEKYGNCYYLYAPENKLPWPSLYRDDWNDVFWEFADWAEKSRGFWVY